MRPLREGARTMSDRKYLLMVDGSGHIPGLDGKVPRGHRVSWTLLQLDLSLKSFQGLNFDLVPNTMGPQDPRPLMTRSELGLHSNFSVKCNNCATYCIKCRLEVAATFQTGIGGGRRLPNGGNTSSELKQPAQCGTRWRCGTASVSCHFGIGSEQHPNH